LICHHDNGDRLSRLLGRTGHCEISTDKDIDFELQELVYKAWDPARLSFGAAIFNHDVFPLNITEIAQPLPECFDVRPWIGGIASS
jgi:hypothetical protein